MAFITETWLTDRVDHSAVGINGFSLIRRDRHLKTGGGVCMNRKILQKLKIALFAQRERI